jgi:hypothetical protein
MNRSMRCAGNGKENTLEIHVTRRPTIQGATIGDLDAGVFRCYTLEDAVREPASVVWPGDGEPKTTAEWVQSWKIPHVTAIPRGRYELIITPSEHFGCDLPLLLNVPGYTAVRIHWGNKAADTDGCILLGLTTQANLIYESKAAFKVFFPILKAALARGPAFITVH